MDDPFDLELLLLFVDVGAVVFASGVYLMLGLRAYRARHLFDLTVDILLVAAGVAAVTIGVQAISGRSVSTVVTRIVIALLVVLPAARSLNAWTRTRKFVARMVEDGDVAPT